MVPFIDIVVYEFDDTRVVVFVVGYNAVCFGTVYCKHSSCFRHYLTTTVTIIVIMYY